MNLRSSLSSLVSLLPSISTGIMLLTAVTASAIPPKMGYDPTGRQKYKVYVDSDGIMRRNDTNEEVAYYGTNYTAPFAYSYRALKALGKDPRDAISKDIYHIARLGLNGFRLHLWDVELSDSLGNLKNNEHLDLLDFMIAELEKRGIDIVLTAQTNFGNGYPEKDIDTGSFTYRFPKCGIHEDPEAQRRQIRYLDALARHINPYTGRSYADDNAIIAMEINNEPCHNGTPQEVTRYINLMASTLRDAGFDKPILYNVSHNPEVTEAYYKAKIDGTTFQWYPTGLVAGHERKGNFLPALDNYTIPWKDSMPGYDKMARVVYEFDPADVLYSHLYPAIARTFRKEGFQWITQFAYDPLYLAPYNTEYPTHFLNLVYTPAKALSMMIAAEATREIPRGADYGTYPANTSFGHTTVSYDPDLSVFNSDSRFIYTNTTDIQPVASDKLELLAGHGSSPLVHYEGSGAYFLDRLGDSGLWRLEVMPDVEIMSDPFALTDTLDTKVIAVARKHKMLLDIPALGKDFILRPVVSGEDGSGKIAGAETPDITAAGGEVTVSPGTYLIAPRGVAFPDRRGMLRGHYNNLGIAEYAAPDYSRTPITLLAPQSSDRAIDINMIPEEWNWRLEYKDLGYAEPKFYEISLHPSADGKSILRRYVGDLIKRLPEEIKLHRLNIQFTDSLGQHTSPTLPEGTEIAVVTRSGRTYSAPVYPDSKGHFAIDLASLAPRTGLIIPAPYPTMLSREIPAPGADEPQAPAYTDIEYVEIILPHRARQTSSLHLFRIYLD